jgi:hypothetical protein
MRLVVSETTRLPCAGRVHDFRANAQGEFYSPPIQSFSLTLAVMAHTFFPWAVCIRSENTWKLLHQARTYTLVDTGPSFLAEFECALEFSEWRCRVTENWSPSASLIERLQKLNQ